MKNDYKLYLDLSNNDKMEKSRREFLKSFGKHVVGGTVGIALHAPALLSGGIAVGIAISDTDEYGPSIEEIKERGAEIYQQENFIDTQQDYPGGGRLHNYGVFHTKKYFELQKKRLEELIDQGDIILLEDGDVAFYFQELATWAKSKGKEVYFIDPANRFIMDLLGGITIVSTVLAVSNILSTQDLSRDKISRRQWFKRWIVSNGLSVFGVISPSFVYSLFTTSKESYRCKKDFSFVGDGRTVFMKKYIGEVIKNNPGKTVVSITGSQHARGIQYYQKNPELADTKYKVYKVLYGALSSDIRPA